MDRICIQLPGEDREALQRMAAEEHVSVAELVRRSIRRALAERGKPSRRDLMTCALAAAGCGHSGLGDVAERHDDYLAEEGGNGSLGRHLGARGLPR